MIGWAVETLIATTLLMLVALVLRGPVRRAFGPGVAYLLWLLPLARMVLPPLPASWRETAAAPLAGKRACIIGASPGATGTVRAQDQLRLVLRRAGALVEPQGEVLVFQAHTKIADGRLADERTRELLARHLHNFLGTFA